VPTSKSEGAGLWFFLYFFAPLIVPSSFRFIFISLVFCALSFFFLIFLFFSFLLFFVLFSCLLLALSFLSVLSSFPFFLDCYYVCPNTVQILWQKVNVILRTRLKLRCISFGVEAFVLSASKLLISLNCCLDLKE